MGRVLLLFPGQERLGPGDVLWIEAGELFELLRPGQVWRPGAPDESRTWLQDYVARRAETSERTRVEREAALDQLLAMLWDVLIGPGGAIHRPLRSAAPSCGSRTSGSMRHGRFPPAGRSGASSSDRTTWKR